MSDEKKFNSFGNVVVEIVGPLLIMLMIGSLAFFMLEVSYGGQYTQDLKWKFGLFTFAAVLISRISIQLGFERAAIYGLVLALAILFVTSRYISAMMAAPIIAMIWWSASRLTWDCTFINDTRDTSAHGIVDLVSFNFRKLKATLTGKPLDQDEQDFAPVFASEESAPKEDEKEEPHKQVLRFLFGRRQPNKPGLWVFYFVLAGFPIFGLGQAAIDSTNVLGRRYAPMYFSVYMISALGLLMMSSLLGLSRYLKIRNATIGLGVTRSWLILGTVLAIGILAFTFWMPRPTSTLSIAGWIPKLTSKQREGDSWFSQKGNQQSEQDPSINAGANSRDNQSSRKDGKQKTGGGENNGKADGNRDKANDSKGGNSNDSGGKQEGGDHKQGKDGKGGSSNQSGGKKQSGSSQGKKKSGQQQKSQTSKGNQSKQKQDGKNKNNSDKQKPGNKQDPSEKQKQDQSKNTFEPDEKKNRYQSEQLRKKHEEQQKKKKNQSQGSQSSRNNKNQSQQNKKDEDDQNSGRSQSRSDNNRNDQQKNDKDKDPSNNDDSSNNQGASFWKLLTTFLQMLFWFVLIVVGIYLLYRYREEIVAAWHKFVEDWRAFWENLFKRKTTSPTGHQESNKESASLRPMPFSSFQNPFSSGAAGKMAPEQLVEYSFRALEAWGYDNHCPRHPDDTPHEFSNSIAQVSQELGGEAQELADLYCQIAYARRSLSPEQVKNLPGLWNRMQSTSIVPPTDHLAPVIG